MFRVSVKSLRVMFVKLQKWCTFGELVIQYRFSRDEKLVILVVLVPTRKVIVGHPGIFLCVTELNKSISTQFALLGD
jgi:hypothetical protein